MPTPAGTGMSRRGFVARSLGLALTVYGARRLDIFDEGIAAAASAPQSPILVTVFLQGGADALSLLHPDGDPLYRKYRTQLAVSGGSPFAEDPRLFWHPALSPLATLHGEGKVSVLPAVGYDHPDQSHFTSRHFWEVGATDTRLVSGWMGRYLDAAGAPDNPLQGLSLTGSLQPTLATTRVPVAAIDGPGQYDFWTPGVWGEVQTRMLDTIGALGGVGGSDADDARGGRRDEAGRHAPPPAGAVPGREARDAAGRVPGRQRLVPPEPAGARGDDRRRAAAPLRRSRGDRRVRHARRPGRRSRPR